MISQCAAISSNLGFQFCQLVVIEWPGNLVLQLGRQHFLMSQKHSVPENVASQKIDSAESKIDGIEMQNEGIKQEEVMALFCWRSGRQWQVGTYFTFPTSPFVSLSKSQKPSNYLPHRAPCQADSVFWKFIPSYHRFKLSQ